VHDGDRVGALEPRDRAAYGGEQVALVQRVHQVRDHLAVGLGDELVAGALQFLANLLVVLDDAVVDDGDLATREVRVRVVVTGAPCVAQRVCEMPSSPARPDLFNCASRSATRSVLRERVSAPSASSATPQES